MRARTLEEADMTGDGQFPARARVVVLGVGTGADHPAGACADVLGEAEHVLVDPRVERTVLFYAEAWRVERSDPTDAVRAVIERLPAGTVVVAVPGEPGAEPAWSAVLDGLRVAVPAEVVVVPGVSVVPPRLSPLW